MRFSVLQLITLGAAVQAANVVKQHVVYSASGVASVVGNGFGCVHITPATGSGSQLGCVKHVFNDGFTVGITSEKTKVATLCSIAGTQGACGPDGINIAVDLTGGTGTAPPPSGAGGTTTLTQAELQNKPIPGNSALASPGTQSTSASQAPQSTNCA